MTAARAKDAQDPVAEARALTAALTAALDALNDHEEALLRDHSLGEDTALQGDVNAAIEALEAAAPRLLAELADEVEALRQQDHEATFHEIAVVVHYDGPDDGLADAVRAHIATLESRVPVVCGVCRGECAVCPHCRSPGPTVTGTSAIEVERGDLATYACCGGPWTVDGSWKCSACGGIGVVWEEGLPGTTGARS